MANRIHFSAKRRERELAQASRREAKLTKRMRRSIEREQAPSAPADGVSDATNIARLYREAVRDRA